MAPRSQGNRFSPRGQARSTFSLLMALAVMALLPLAAPGMTARADLTGKASGAQLIMVEDPGCPYCARWDAEVGISYAASAEGRFAPLVRRSRNHPDVKKLGNVIYSPTFILVRDGLEIGRIVGYPGADFFWGLLGELLEQAGFRHSAGGS